MKSSVDISVVICAYTEERWANLKAAIRSIQHQRLAPYEIIVVIDHNRALWVRLQEGLATMKGKETSQVRLIENGQPQGLSGARNSGIAAATGEIVAFMDEDAVADPNWLTYLAAGYVDECVMGVGGAIVASWESGRPAWFPREFDWVVGCTYLGMPRVTAPVRNLIGCNMSFRRTLFTAIGGFCHDMGRIGARPLGCEETEFCIRATQQWPDKVLLYEPLAQVHHHVTPQRATWRYFYARCYAEGLSKAQVTQKVGVQDGLAAERSYTLRTLPQGAIVGLRDGCLRGDMGGFGRTIAIGAGLAVTTIGYVAGRAHRILATTKPATGQRALTPAKEQAS